MKKAHFTKIIFIISIFCVLSFSKVVPAFFQQQPSFSMFHQNTICQQLVSYYITEDGDIKPTAQAKLPLEYYLHESIPQQYRPLIYNQEDDWNNTTGKRVLQIHRELDRGTFDPQVNKHDQKNVIYLASSEDYAQVLNSPDDASRNLYALIPGISNIPRPDKIPSDLPFVPITDADIIIREEALTDIGFYRSQLLLDLENLGIEGDFSNESFEVIKNTILDHIRNMNREDFETFLREQIESFSNTETSTSTPDAVSRRIQRIQNMTDQQIRRHKTTIANRFSLVSASVMESQHPFVLHNTVGHQIGHGLGLRDYIVPPDHFMRDRNVMKPHTAGNYGDMIIPKEIDPFAVYGLFCLYSEYPSFTQR